MRLSPILLSLALLCASSQVLAADDLAWALQQIDNIRAKQKDQ